MLMKPEQDQTPITEGSCPIKSCLTGYNSSESSRIDLVSCLAQTILEGLEDMEREKWIGEMKALPPEIALERQRLLREISALKARLRGLAQGV